MKNKKKILIDFIIFLLELILWIFIWGTLKLDFFGWKFWVVFFSVIGLIILEDIKRTPRAKFKPNPSKAKGNPQESEDKHRSR